MFRSNQSTRKRTLEQKLPTGNVKQKMGDVKTEVIDIESTHVPISRRKMKNKTPISVIYLSDDEPEPPVQSLRSLFTCSICADDKFLYESFSIKDCSHSYCSACVVKYIASRVEENVTSITCPELNCEGVLEPELCMPILPPELFDRWGSALCESLIVGSQKFYCPFRDCSGVLMKDGGVVVKEAECPHCRRLFCAQCKVAWHSDVSCEQFQKLNPNERGREDILAMKLAQEKKWQRCPKCNIYIEKITGCVYVKCRCGRAFCYQCAGPIEPSHHCRRCNRTYPPSPFELRDMKFMFFQLFCPQAWIKN